MNSRKYKSVDEYLKYIPIEAKLHCELMRKVIKETVPDAEEIISYNMPAYKTKKVLVYFMAHKNHVGFYPTSIGIKQFEKEISKFKWSKGAVQFPYHQKIPKTLVKNIVKFRVKTIANF